ncbi:MAG: molybdopterin molybdotransferase MoeA [Leptolyngbyaceae cyanobacterium bins.59]|nr:molybdopterin molybdotransferase MoeA [Leptolyngbyaceae cyanobacterium bins.59]
MFSVQQAEALILDLVKPLGSEVDVEIVSLQQASGRLVAQPIVSSLDFPHWDNSAMDGYAVRWADIQNSQSEPLSLQVIEEIPAGCFPKKVVGLGQAAQIFTGAMMPEGADTVVMQEQTQREGDRVLILTPPKQSGSFVRCRGAFYRAGEILLPPGIQLQAPDVAVLAAAQCAQVTVYRCPRVVLLSTGDELVGLTDPLGPGQIVDSNFYALSDLVTRSGAVSLFHQIVADRPEALKAAIAEAIRAGDLVISSGGVSVGEYDYVETILQELGATLHIRSVAMRPGKPLTVATFPPTGDRPRTLLYFGLPGNPVSALVTFWRFVQPALKKLAGLTEGVSPLIISAQTRQDLRSDGQRETYLWGRLVPQSTGIEFSLAGGSHSSGNLVNLAQTNALAVIPVGETLIPAGEKVPVMMVGG